MKTILFISLAFFVGYIASVVAAFKIPPSISESFYLLDKQKKNLGYLFTIWCYFIGISVMGMMFELSTDKWYQFLGLFAGGGLGFVGTAPLFKSHEKTVHYVSATVCTFSSLIWMFLSGFWMIPLGLLTLALCVSFKYSHTRVFWLEIAVFVSMYTALVHLIV
ncbi:hypothetical protein EZS27_004587 [termite gut metagenome]|uniref:DUF998 domain-containing protein n=1 Tax=termite gut metagenome TaxID=433724 RepID=A0A5J4SPW9_9ZZZZ